MIYPHSHKKNHNLAVALGFELPPWAAAVSAKTAGMAEEEAVWGWEVLVLASSSASAAALDSDSLFSARSEA